MRGKSSTLGEWITTRFAHIAAWDTGHRPSTLSPRDRRLPPRRLPPSTRCWGKPMCNHPEMLTYDWIKTGGRAPDKRAYRKLGVLGPRQGKGLRNTGFRVWIDFL